MDQPSDAQGDAGEPEWDADHGRVEEQHDRDHREAVGDSEEESVEEPDRRFPFTPPGGGWGARRSSAAVLRLR